MDTDRWTGTFETPTGPSDDTPAMARSLAALFVAGGAIGAISLALPHPILFNDAALWSNTGLAFVGALSLALLARRLPVWSLQVALALGTVLITRAVYYSGEAPGFYVFFYIWVGLYAFFYFGQAGGAAHMAWVGVAFAWVLTRVDHTSGIALWLVTVGTIAIAGVFVSVLARREQRRAVEADARARALTAVDLVAHELARSTTPDAAALAICKAAVQVADAAGAILFEPTPDGGGLRAIAATDPEARQTTLSFVGQASGAVRAFTSRDPFFAGEAIGNSAVDQSVAQHLGAGSALFQPILREGTPVGVLAVYWGEPLASLDDELAQIVTLLAAEASFAIERAELLERLERAARTDDLTGLPNRRAWDEELTREIARARRSKASLCVAMLDLDHFKEFNDRLGHQAGDRLLKEAAARWGERLRDTDLLARYGGDEFAIALPECSLDEAAALLERLRAATPEEERSSAGVVAWNGSENESELLTRADKALYRAKNDGRDRIIEA
jgi:diguanylate cyclase (GGDEF)-like protein